MIDYGEYLSDEERRRRALDTLAVRSAAPPEPEWGSDSSGGGAVDALAAALRPPPEPEARAIEGLTGSDVVDYTPPEHDPLPLSAADNPDEDKSSSASRQVATVDDALEGLTGSAPKLAAPPVAVTKTEVVVEKPKKDEEETEPVAESPAAEKAEEKAAAPTPAATSTKQAESPTVGRINALRDRLAAGEFSKQQNDAADELAGREPGVSPWAVLASVILNKGRDLGHIISTAEQQKSQWKHDRLAQARAKGGDALEREMKLIQLEQAGERIGNVEEGRGLQERKLDHTIQEHANRDDPNSARRATERTQRELTSAAGVRGRKNEEHALIDQSADDARTLATARRDGAQDAEAANADRTAGVRAKVAAAGAAASETARNLAQGSTPRPITPDQEHDNKNDDEELALRKTREEREKILADEALHSKKTREFNNDYQPTYEGLVQVKKVLDFVRKHKNDVDMPGVGVIEGQSWYPDALKDESTIDMQKALRWFQEPIRKEQFGSAFTVPEQRIALEQLGNTATSNPYTLESSLNTAYDVFTKRLRDGAGGKEDVAREILRKQGLESDVFDSVIADSPEKRAIINDVLGQGGGGGIATPPPASPTASPEAAAQLKAIQDQATAAGKLTDTGSRNNAPPLPTDAVPRDASGKPLPSSNVRSGPPVTVTLKSPSGNTGQKTMTEQELSKFLLANPKWSVVEQ